MHMIETRVVFLIFSFFLGTDSSCELEWVSHCTSCYKYVAGGSTWSSAKTSCEQMGAYLVVIKNEEEHDFLSGRFVDNYWLGLSDLKREGDFTWVDGGEYSNYTNWALGEPNDAVNEDCVEMNRHNEYKWNDVACYKYFSYICEKYQFYQDIEPPSYGSTCPDDVHYILLNTTKSMPVYWRPPAWTDDSLCAVKNVTSGFYSPGHVIEIPDDVLSSFITVTYTAYDAEGNSNTCSFRVSVSNVQSYNQCINGGAMAISSGTVSCACVPGFSGLNCEVKNDFPYECLNGGTLVDSNVTTPYCLCDLEFSGVFCESGKSKDVVTVDNICLSNTCNNNGTCAIDPNLGGYMCFCSDGFSGQFCDEFDLEFFADLQFYAESQYRCLNGGTLHKSEGTTSYCACVSGFSGEACEFNNICSSNPCKGNGTCALYPTHNEYRCFFKNKGIIDDSDDIMYLIAVVICLLVVILVMAIAITILFRKNRLYKAEYPVDISMVAVKANTSSWQVEQGYGSEKPGTPLL